MGPEKVVSTQTSKAGGGVLPASLPERPGPVKGIPRSNTTEGQVTKPSRVLEKSIIFGGEAASTSKQVRPRNSPLEKCIRSSSGRCLVGYPTGYCLSQVNRKQRRQTLMIRVAVTVTRGWNSDNHLPCFEVVY